jgi:Gly-Xaa carboxypeptidase
MAPAISTGNTDTKRYWNLTRAIYRWVTASDGATSRNIKRHCSVDPARRQADC